MRSIRLHKVVGLWALLRLIWNCVKSTFIQIEFRPVLADPPPRSFIGFKPESAHLNLVSPLSMVFWVIDDGKKIFKLLFINHFLIWKSYKKIGTKSFCLLNSLLVNVIMDQQLFAFHFLAQNLHSFFQQSFLDRSADAFCAQLAFIWQTSNYIFQLTNDDRVRLWCFVGGF